MASLFFNDSANEETDETDLDDSSYDDSGESSELSETSGDDHSHEESLYDMEIENNASGPQLFIESNWPVIQKFVVCRSVFPPKQDLRSYDLSELEKYSKKDEQWLSKVSIQHILRLIVRRNGRVAHAWRQFRTFEIAEEYCSRGNSWPIAAGF